MRKYFDLTDDLYFPNRWVLDDPVNDEGCNEDDFTVGLPVNIRSTPNIAIKTAGIPLDYTHTLLDVPVATHRVAEVFSKIAGSDIQRITATVDNRPGYEIINICRLVPCLDERLSIFTKWTAQDHRPELAGHYRMVGNLMVDPQRIPPSTHAFRIERWEPPIIVSDKLMEALLSVGAVGVKFTPVS